MYEYYDEKKTTCWDTSKIFDDIKKSKSIITNNNYGFCNNKEFMAKNECKGKFVTLNLS